VHDMQAAGKKEKDIHPLENIPKFNGPASDT
jgi:hypothetical protein